MASITAKKERIGFFDFPSVPKVRTTLTLIIVVAMNNGTKNSPLAGMVTALH